MADYPIRARNVASHSENKIHDDTVAAQYGFQGGLVPGVTIYGYMASAVVRELSLEWLERGSMQVRFQQPFYDGDPVAVHTEPVDGNLNLTAARLDGAVCATGCATMRARLVWTDDIPEHALPEAENRPEAVRDSFLPGATLGTLRVKLDLDDAESLERLAFDTMAQPAAVYRGHDGVAHPAVLLGLSNRIFLCNFRLGPWIHAGSELTNWGVARHGDEIVVKGRVEDRFERKGHEFVVLDLSLSAAGGRPVQRVRHTAIYKPRPLVVV